MELTSPAFQNGGIIPSKFTCEGKNLSPELHIRDVPKEAKSLILIMDDPDVPAFVRPDRMYDHWVAYDIDPQTRKIGEGQTVGIQGKNTGGKNGYTGPCPPDREHRYFFKLYALDQKLGLPPGASKKKVEAAMEGRILAEVTLMGRYEKGKGY